MSFNETHLLVVFSDSDACTKVQELFDLLSEDPSAFNKAMSSIGVKTKFTDEDPYLERMVGADSTLALEFSHSSSFRFPAALTKKLPGAILIIQTVMDDSSLAGRKSYYYQGVSIKKDQLVGCLDALDPRVAAILASQLGVRLASKYFKALPDFNEEFSGSLLFWYLLQYAIQFPATQKILEKCDIKRLTSRGENALHFAARNYGILGDEELSWLIAQGCDVNAINDVGDTPLLIASRLDDARNGAMRKLLHNGANSNVRDKKGLTAVHYHCATGLWLDMMSPLKYCNADLNADSPWGSPLWIANARKRNAAREKLWHLNLTLSYPSSAYEEDVFENLRTATKHNDLISLARFIGEAQLNRTQVAELYCYACYYRCSLLFNYLHQVYPDVHVANTRDTVFGEEYLLNYLRVPDDDSYGMLVSVIAQSSPEQLNELVKTRMFLINCQEVILSLSHLAPEFFQMLKLKSVVLGGLFQEFKLSLVWRPQKAPEDIGSILMKLRELGLIFWGAERQLNNIKVSKELAQRLCAP